MTNGFINIDFKLLAAAFQKHVREKATRAGGTIVYKEGNCLIEEDPSTSKKIILKYYT